MSMYKIVVSGCHDATYVVMELDAVIARLAAIVAEASTSGCMPTVQIKGPVQS